VYEPKRPNLVAAGLLSLWVAILAWPMLAGKWLASPWSDQYSAGYAFRAWGAEWWHRLGHVPLWNPEIFGGLPFVAAQHGDIFYPTSFLRLVLPTVTVMNLGFVIHYLLAGLFTYFLLRLLKVSWTGAVVGALAYQLSGEIASYPSPGHDGKLFVSTLLPLALIGLVVALRDRRAGGYALLALAVGLALLSPHYQMTYYLLIALGLFALYLTLEESGDATPGTRSLRLGVALGAVLVGFGIAMIQILPFYHYLPYSPRAQGYYGFEGSTSYAIPWVHVPEFFLKNFVGSRETYWGSNPLKLHSEYLGLPVVALAILGAATPGRRRLIAWLAGIGGLFLLVSLGAATPFYRVWWALMPYVRQTRAPGMAFFVVAFVMALLAGFGAERLEAKQGSKHALPWLVAGGVILLLGVSGTFGKIAAALAGAQGASAAQQAAPGILVGAATSGLALVVVAALVQLFQQGRLAASVFSVTLGLAVGADLWLNADHFWVYSTAHRELYRPDPVTQRLKATPLPYRVVDLGVYPSGGVSLMAFDIPQLLGHHGNEIHRFDELWGGKNQYGNLRYLPLWDLFDVRYAIVPTGARHADSIPGFKRILDSVTTAAGVPASLFERETPAPYARVIPGAIKADSDAIVATLLDPRMDYSRLVLYTNTEPIAVERPTKMPEPSPSRASVTAWEPGRMTVTLEPAPPTPSYLLVAENWYPDWRASVDGRPVPVTRGDFTLLTVPVPAGARTVELTFQSRDYETGKAISLASLALLVVVGVAPIVARRARHG
jgi:membrane protein YfhO